MSLVTYAPTADPHGLRSPGATEVAKALARVALGWFLLNQGWGKVVQDLTEGAGSFYRGDQFQNSNPEWLPTVISAPYGYALPWIELVAGALLLLGAFNRVSAGVATFVLLSIAVAWLDAGNLLPRHMLMVFAPLGAYFFFAGPGRFSVDAALASRKGRELQAHRGSEGEADLKS